MQNFASKNLQKLIIGLLSMRLDQLVMDNILLGNFLRIKYDLAKVFQSHHNMMVSHARAVKLFKMVVTRARLVWFMLFQQNIV